MTEPAEIQRPPRTRRQMATLLSWAGVAPFLIWAVVAWSGAPGWLIKLLVGYGVLTLAFMNGTLWAGALAHPERPEAPLVASIVLVLAALPALLLPAVSASALLAVLFVLHWVAEYAWIRDSQPRWYKGLRTATSAAVVALLVLALVLALGR